MSAAVLLPLVAALVVVLVAVVALVLVLRSARRRREEQERAQEHRPLDPSVIECFPTGYQPPARPGAKGETPTPAQGARTDDTTG